MAKGFWSNLLREDGTPIVTYREEWDEKKQVLWVVCDYDEQEFYDAVVAPKNYDKETDSWWFHHPYLPPKRWIHHDYIVDSGVN